MTKTEQMDPDTLLESMKKSVMTQAIALAFLVHAAITFGTSFGLYKDWAYFYAKDKEDPQKKGFTLYTPSTIKVMKNREIKQAEEAKRKAIADEKLGALTAAATKDAPAADKPKTPAKDEDFDIPPDRDLNKQVLPPKGSFDLKDIDLFD